MQTRCWIYNLSASNMFVANARNVPLLVQTASTFHTHKTDSFVRRLFTDCYTPAASGSCMERNKLSVCNFC